MWGGTKDEWTMCVLHYTPMYVCMHVRTYAPVVCVHYADSQIKAHTQKSKHTLKSQNTPTHT